MRILNDLVEWFAGLIISVLRVIYKFFFWILVLVATANVLRWLGFV